MDTYNVGKVCFRYWHIPDSQPDVMEYCESGTIELAHYWRNADARYGDVGPIERVVIVDVDPIVSETIER